MFKPKVSIIIPVYNGSNYLLEAINSALEQTYDNIEILVINDGSNDKGNTEKIAKSLGDKIRYFRKKNGGVSSALNLGIKKMTGEYFSWLSHDDLYYPNKIEEQISFLNNLKDKNSIISTDIDIINGKGILEKTVNKDYNKNSFLKELMFNGIINGCTLLINKNIFKNIGNFNNKFKTIQDYDLWIRASKYTKFIHLNKVLVKSRNHSEQDSKKKINFVISEINDLQKSLFNSYTLNELKVEFKWKRHILLLYVYIKFKFLLRKIIWYIVYITMKLKIYKYISPLWRKIILKNK